MNKRKENYHLKVDLRAFFAPLEKPVMYGELPSIDMLSTGNPSCASKLVVCPFPRNFFSMATVHAEIMERGFEVYLPQTMEEVKADLDSILSQQPLLPSLSDAKKLVKGILPYHPIIPKTK